ncbi:hypothetical protein RND71_042674 [Anisodus tanguticus]|uniref:Uncharacterized protein n=1 Tax=Anisodus tanguticus TaxID=243964 RepID=A0AAE1QTV9_9SOLA|nr:hypothetical protein RND71_042674 [Anisodus tanguticus]
MAEPSNVVVRSLIKRVYTLNEGNAEGFTAFDIVLRLPIESSREIKKVLQRAGVCRASLLPSVYSKAQFFSSKEHMSQKIVKLHAFHHIGLPEDTRSLWVTHRATVPDRMQYRLVAKKYSSQVGHKCKGIHCNDNIGILHNLAFLENDDV